MGRQIKKYEDATGTEIRELWSRVDFVGPSKRVTQIRARPVASLPNDLRDEMLDVLWFQPNRKK